MKKILVIISIAFCALPLHAYDLAGVNQDGDSLWFNDVSKGYGRNAVEVTYKGSWYGAVADEYADTIRIPDFVTIKGKSYEVVGIGEQAFAECFKLISVTIPESMLYIREGAFQFCCHMTQVNYNAKRCADLTLPSFAPFSFGNVAYGEYVDDDNDGYSDRFWSAYDLKEVNIGAAVERIPDYMFYGLGGGLQQADLSKRPYEIVNSKGGVAHINFLGSPKEIGTQAFRACRLLEDMVIPASVTSIGQAMLANCDTLMSVTLPEGIEEIPAYFFSGNRELCNINFPTTLKRINYESFKNCAKLTNVVLPEGLEVVGPSAFRSCENLQTVQLPSTLTTIDGYGFSDCTALTAINIPTGVKQIGNYAFEDCTNLGNVTINEGTELIGNFVFAGCLKLSEGKLHAPAKMPKIQENTFEGVQNSMQVIVPEESLPEYRADAYWGRFFMPAGTEDIRSNANTAKKTFTDGVVTIEKDGVRYYIGGQQAE